MITTATNYTSLADVPELPDLRSPAVSPEPVGTPQDSVTPPKEKPEESPSYVKDILAAPFRGVASAAGGLYNLADTLDNFTGADVLPTLDIGSALGHSKTLPGSLVEGISQFLVGFVPVAGWLGRVGALTNAAGKLSFAGNTIAGAAATFAVFEGSQGRLSDLINEKFPALKNPVTDFLSTSPDDGEAVGRLKNALEGAGIGAAVDGLLVGIKAIRAGAAAKAAGKDAEAVNAAMAAEAHPETITKAVDDLASKEVPGTPLHDVESGMDGTPGIVKPKAGEAAAVWTPDPNAALAAVKHYLDTGEVTQIDPRIFNVGAITNDETRADFISHIVKLFENTIASDKGPRVNDAESFRKSMAFFADAIGTDSGETLAFKLQKDVSSMNEMYARAGAYRLTLASLYKDMAAKATAAVSGDDAAKLAFVDAFRAHSTFLQGLSHLGTGMGRGLRAFHAISGPNLQAFDGAIAEALAGVGGGDAVSTAAKKLLAAISGGGEIGGARMASEKLTLGGRILAVHNEYWMNSILSGPATSVVNTLGNTFSMLYLPLERAAGAARGGDISTSQAFMKMYGYLYEAFNDSLQFSLRSIREGSSALDQAAGTAETAAVGLGGKANPPAITAANFGQDNTSALGSLINHVGDIVRMPNRFLTGADEFFKQINARAAAKARLYTEAVGNAAIRNDPVAVGQYVNSKFSSLLDESGQFLTQAGVARTGESLAKQQGLTGFKAIEFVQKYTQENFDKNKSMLLDYAKDYAQEATFTRPLPKGGIPYRIQQAAVDHPILRMVVPFIRTPVNIIKFAGQRLLPTDMPLIGELHKQFASEITHADPMVRAAAMGRQSLGTSLFIASAAAGYGGVITGGGPTNVQERKQLLATGWQPYSFKMPDGTYVSFQRLDPFATFLGLAGDFSEAANRAYEKDNADFSSIPSLVALATARNFTNKSYLTGISQIVEAMSDPERFMPKLFQRQAGSYIPNLIATSTQDIGDDPYLREVRTVMDALKKRVPGFSDDLDVQRNILGEAIEAPHGRIPFGINWASPVAVSNKKNDPVFDELNKLQAGLSAPREIQNGIDFTTFKNDKQQSAYDRWQELTGTTKVNGKPLRSALESLISSASYQKLSDKATVEYDSPRVQEVRRVINKYRYTALDSMLKEFPELNANWKQNFQNRAALQRGVQVTDLMPLPFPSK